MKPYIGRMPKDIFCRKVLGFSHSSDGRNAEKQVEGDKKGGGDTVK